jgi:hypothetical protein
MIAKMEPGFGATTVTEAPQPKVDPDTITFPPVRQGDTADVPINIKKEDEDVKVNLPPAENEDMFDEVDGPEYVDLSYEGLAEVDGVEHFVCESLFPQMDAYKAMIDTKDKTSRYGRFLSLWL